MNFTTFSRVNYFFFQVLISNLLWRHKLGMYYCVCVIIYIYWNKLFIIIIGIFNSLKFWRKTIYLLFSPLISDKVDNRFQSMSAQLFRSALFYIWMSHDSPSLVRTIFETNGFNLTVYWVYLSIWSLYTFLPLPRLNADTRN